MELNMPRSGAGFRTGFTLDKRKRSSSFLISLSSIAQTTATCSEPRTLHCLIRCARTEFSPHGSNSFGCPMRLERPAPRITVPSINRLLFCATIPLIMREVRVLHLSGPQLYVGARLIASGATFSLFYESNLDKSFFDKSSASYL